MMIFFDKAMRALARIATPLMRLRERHRETIASDQRKNLEAERLDRLRNPSNYQGR